PGGSREGGCRLVPRSCCLPEMAGGSASALSLSRPAQALLALRPVESLSRPAATFVTRLRPRQLPSRVARQLLDQSTIIQVEPSSTDDSRRQGALPSWDMTPSFAGRGLSHGARAQSMKVPHPERKLSLITTVSVHAEVSAPRRWGFVWRSGIS